MNPKKLYKLQALSKDLSILYIESNIQLQKQLEKVLNKIFSQVFIASDGLEGINKYKKFNPDIILTDLGLKKKNSFEMIVDILEYNPDAIIIVLSELNDDVIFLQSIDIGISQFLFKPFDIDKLVSNFLKIIMETKNNDIDPLSIYHLENIKKQEVNISFINHFKGIPIQCNGKIDSIENNEITIKLQSSQNTAIVYEKQTIIYLEDLNKYIQVELLFSSKRDQFITLINPKFIDFKQRDINYKRINVDKSFKVSLHYHNKVIDVIPIVSSYISIVVFEKSGNEKFKVSDKIDLTLGFEIDGASSLVKEKKFIKIFANGEILRVERYKTGNKIVIKLKVKKAGERTFNNYLQNREMETIQEFKRLIKK